MFGLTIIKLEYNCTERQLGWCNYETWHGQYKKVGHFAILNALTLFTNFSSDHASCFTILQVEVHGFLIVVHCDQRFLRHFTQWQPDYIPAHHTFKAHLQLRYDHDTATIQVSHNSLQQDRNMGGDTVTPLLTIPSSQYFHRNVWDKQNSNKISQHDGCSVWIESVN